MIRKTVYTFKFVVLFLFLAHSVSTRAQTIDSTQTPNFFGGVVTATNNGISLIPNFSLNKPALLFDLSMGKGRLSFDPMLRFGMDGKPWSFVFWWRYKLLNKEKFKMSLGAHPAFLFRSMPLVSNGVTSEYLTAQRFLAWEATPTYYVSPKVGVGIYYLGSHGLSENSIRFTNFVAIRTLLSNITLSDQVSMTFIPQVYYLRMDQSAGTYVNGTVIFRKKNLPFTFSSIVSSAIDTDLAGKKFIWNVGLNYTIDNTYYKARKR